MSEKLGFYELLEPYFSIGLIAQNTSGIALLALRDANAQLNNSFPGASDTLSRIITGILDYLSIEGLHSAVDETAGVYRGIAKFGVRGEQIPNCRLDNP